MKSRCRAGPFLGLLILCLGPVSLSVGGGRFSGASANDLDRVASEQHVSLTLIPPSPVTDRIVLDMRAAVWNDGNTTNQFAVAFYLDAEAPEKRLHQATVEVAPKASAGIQSRWLTKGQAGSHRILLVAQSRVQTLRCERSLQIIKSDARSLRRLAGAWVDLYHHDPAEGKPFNEELGKMTDSQWRELVRAMHEVEQNVLVITMMFQNFTHRGRHRIETEGYQGRAYYPSRLFPGRMAIAARDPLEAILSEADQLGMHVMPGVGMYAFFDFTPGALRWHKQVAAELWERYGHHPSFYGWYISAEKDGGLGDVEERREIVGFFREFTPYLRRLAPDKPVMLAPNCFRLRGAEETYRQLLPHLDILCPFGFHRLPAGDLPGEDAATLMQSLCDETGCHLWMDLESFVFRHGVELHPRPIQGLISDFSRFANFEKTLHYQFPGLMCAPWMSRRPGGDAAVQLYRDYQKFLHADAEAQAIQRSADWVFRSRILRHPAWPGDVLQRSLTYNTVRDPPRAEWPPGDGSFGLLEGFSSSIRLDGSQPMRYAVRNDCVLETAMLLALDALSPDRHASAHTASNLVEYLFQHSGLAGGPRADPGQASYGLVGWALDSPGAYWGDDNARALLGLAAASVALRESRWDEPLARCLLANFRTTGRTGFREACVTDEPLRTKGWLAYWNARPVQYSPHFQSWLWACFFWAYDATHFEPLRERSLNGLRDMMAAYPRQWDWVIRSSAIERARALLPLAWLIRIEDTPEHRGWLRRVAEDLLATQDASGAIRETIGDGRHGTTSNAEYGTRETTLIQTNGDPVCDLLYTCNFALIGLHEAAAATGEPFYREAGDRLARFLCRVQIRSESHPELDGAWYRAFDFRRWEYWASNADWEWGPWCIESGWTQPWIAGTLALRQRETSLWDLIRRSRMHEHFTRLRPQMLPDEALLP